MCNSWNGGPTVAYDTEDVQIMLPISCLLLFVVESVFLSEKPFDLIKESLCIVLNDWCEIQQSSEILFVIAYLLFSGKLYQL